MRIHHARGGTGTALLFSAVVAAFAAAAPAVPQSPDDWIEVGRGQQATVSGIARVAESGGTLRFLIVHDNKNEGEARLALITLASPVRYTPVRWPSGYALPVDLEAVAAIPGVRGLFAVATSGGTVSLLSLTGDRAQLRDAFTLPRRPGIPAFEAFDVQMIGATRVAIWGQRGAGRERGRLYWGRFELNRPRIVDISEAEIIVPFPSPDDSNTRHISDIKVDARTGDVWSTAAYDPGDSGPYVSAVYHLGRLVASGRTIRFEPRGALTPLHNVNRKIEALELVGDRLALATDDEHGGAAIAMLPR